MEKQEIKKKQRVLLVHNSYKIPGGEDTVVANEKQLLEEHGHQVYLYSRSNREMDKFSALQKLLLPLTALFSLRTYREVKRLIGREKIDIVHVHNTLSLVSPSVYYAAFACKRPVVQTVHNFRLLCPAATFLRDGKICEDCVEKGLGCAVRFGCYRGSKAQSFMSAAILKLHRWLGTYRKLYYISLTEFNREKLLLLDKNGEKVICPDRVFVKTNFVSSIQRLPTEDEEKMEGYVFVGRLERLKGIWILLQAWEAFSEKKLLICGSGPEERRIKNFLKIKKMDQVRLLGQLPHGEVLRLLAKSKALIMPTMWYEGQPMAILESYAVGTPVIVSDIGNPKAMVIPGVTGLRFRRGDVESLRQAVNKLEEMTNWNTRQVYEQLYTPEKNYEILRDIYDRVQENDE